MISTAQVLVFLLSFLTNDPSLSSQAKIEALTSVQSAISQDLEALGSAQNQVSVKGVVDQPVSQSVSSPQNPAIVPVISVDSFSYDWYVSSSTKKFTVNGKNFDSGVSIKVQVPISDNPYDGMTFASIPIDSIASDGSSFSITLPVLPTGRYQVMIYDNGKQIRGMQGSFDIIHPDGTM